MAKYFVYEVQRVEVWKKWRYEVEAESANEAEADVLNGKYEPEDWGQYGDDDYGASAFVVTQDNNDGAAWEKAANKLSGQV